MIITYLINNRLQKKNINELFHNIRGKKSPNAATGCSNCRTPKQNGNDTKMKDYFFFWNIVRVHVFLCDGESKNANNIMDTIIIHTMRYGERVGKKIDDNQTSVLRLLFYLKLKHTETTRWRDILWQWQRGRQSWSKISRTELEQCFRDPLQRCLYLYIRRAVGIILLCTALYSKCQHV